MATVRELITTWGFKVDLASLDKMDARVGDITKNVSRVGQNIDRVSRSMIGFGTRLTAFVTVPIVGLGAVLANVASDAEETESKFATVFKDIESSADGMAKNLRDNFGLGQVEAKKLLGDTGDLLTGFGFSQKAALDLSTKVQELAVDLSSFTNNTGGAQAASDALTKALLGERESVKSLGISILEEDVKKQVAVNSTKGLTFESNRQAKAFATLQIAQRQSQNAIGDFARTQGSTANQMKLLTRDIKDESLALGKILLPILTEVVSMAREGVFWFSQLEQGTKENILVFLGLAATLGPIILTLGILGASIVGIAKGYSLLKLGIQAVIVAQRTLTISMLLFPILALALGVALGILIDDFKNFFQGNKSAIGVWLGDWVDAKDSILQVWDDIVAGVSMAIEKIADLIKNPIEEVKSLIRDTASLPGFLGIAGGALNVGTELTTSVLGREDVLSPVVGRGSVSRKNSSTVNATINLSIPEGTPEQQISQVEEAGKRVVQDEIDIILRRLNNEFPEIE